MTATFGYVSMIRASVDNPQWNDKEGDISLIAGKVSDPYMPTVVDRENESVVGRRYERIELVELPKRMKSDQAFEWVKENGPERIQEWYKANTATEDD